MIGRCIIILIILLASVVFAQEKIDKDKIIWDTDKIKEEMAKQELERLKALREDLKQKWESWQNDLKSGPVGRFQAVAIGQNGAFVLDTKEGRVWAVGATAEGGPKIVYMGQVNPY